MSNLIDTTKNIQRALGGLEVDGKFGMLTATAMMRALNGWTGIEEDAETLKGEEWKTGLDARTVSNIGTLDEKVRPNFAQFTRLANATAATLGCSYVMISADRSYKEQDALYNQPWDGMDNDGDGKTDEADEKVTKAKAGYSNHNFRIAGDYGVFLGKVYADGGTASQKVLAAKVHRACSEHAAECGLEWGGSWKSFKDMPHYEFPTGLTMAQKRAKFSKEGTVV